MRQRSALLVLIVVLLIGSVGGCQGQSTSASGSERSTIFVGMAGTPQRRPVRSAPAAAATAQPEATPTSTPTVTPTTAPPTPAPPALSLRETDNILLLGTDRRPDWDNWRTDTIMILGIDRKYRRAVVLSIPRDLYVTIPGYGQSRINQADYLGEEVLKTEGGGPALVSQVLSQTLGISTEHWVRVELRGFTDMVDALGGVTVHLDCPFYELIYDLDLQDWTIYELPAGDVHMDGETAYRFVTLRYLESDFGRSRRQRQFLWALRDQAVNKNLILRLPELVSAFKQTFSTDLSVLEMIQLARFGLAIDRENVRSAALTGDQLERFITSSGADVLRIRDPSKVSEVIDNAWMGNSLADTGRRNPDTCPPKPNAAPPRYVTDAVNPVLTPQAPPMEEGLPADAPVGGGGGEPVDGEPVDGEPAPADGEPEASGAELETGSEEGG